MSNPNSENDLSQRILLDVIKNEFAFNYNLNEQQQRAQTEVVNHHGNEYRQPAFWPNYDMQNSFIDLNQSFIYVGDNSIFQKRITMILSMQWISFTFLVMGMTYVFRAPVFYCPDGSGGRRPCSQDEACYNGHPLDVVYPISVSIIQQFGLICQKDNYVAFTQSLLFLGGFLSGYIFSYLSSKIGSRSVLIMSMIMATVSVLTCAFSNDYIMFMIGYFFIGFCLFGYETTVYNYIAEMSAIRFRTISINILTIVWAGAPIFFPLVNLSPDWRTTFKIMAAPMLISLPFMYKCFLESPRFLVKKKCFRQARQIFKQISITNKRPPYNFRLEEEVEFQNCKLTRIKANWRNSNASASLATHFQPPKTYNYIDLFKYKSLRKTTFSMMIFWMVRFYVYYGLTLGLQTMGVSGSFLAYTISASSFAEVLGTFGIPIMTIFIFNRYKLDIMRKSILMVSLCCLLLYFIIIPSNCMTKQDKCPEMYQTVTLILIVKFFITIFSTGLISYSNEIFPTDVRSLGSGFCLTFGRLGSIVIPFYINYMKIRRLGQSPLGLLFPFTILVYVISYFLPNTETAGMKDKIEEEYEREEREKERKRRTQNIDSVAASMKESLISRKEKEEKLVHKIVHLVD